MGSICVAVQGKCGVEDEHRARIQAGRAYVPPDIDILSRYSIQSHLSGMRSCRHRPENFGSRELRRERLEQTGSGGVEMRG